MKARGAKEKVRPGSSGWQRARTPTDARQSITQAGDNRGGQQSLTSWLRPKMPSTVRTSAEDSRGGQRLLTSWMRPKSSPAPAVYAALAPVGECISPAPVVRNASPAPAVWAAPAPVVEYISPAPSVSYAEPVPVVEYISPAPANGELRRANAYVVCRTRPSGGVHLSGDSAGLRSTRSSAVCNSSEAPSALRCTHDDCDWSRFEQGRHFRCSPATSVGNPAPIQHGAPVQNGGPLIFFACVLPPRFRMERWCGRCGVPCQRCCAGDKDAVRPCLVVSVTEAVRRGVVLALPRERCSSVLRLASIDESKSESE